MKIFYCGLRYNNYLQSRGKSFEHENFYSALASMKGLEVAYFPFDIIAQIGRKAYNFKLLEAIKQEKPDLVFFFMYVDELIPQLLDEFKRYTNTIAWFADDHWRIWNYSRYYAPHFNWAVTTWSKAPGIYASYGSMNIIRSQWGCNSLKWKPIGHISKDIDVSFIGQWTNQRAVVVQKLRRAGIKIYARGWGWPEGRTSQEELLKIIARSKINLNINDSPNIFGIKYLARLLLLRSYSNKLSFSFNLPDNFKSWKKMSIPQIKARLFELAACGSFVITGYGDDLENFYQENKEMVFYRSSQDLIDKVKYYLPRDEEREKIAAAGYERTLREHTYEKRFLDLFKKIGL